MSIEKLLLIILFVAISYYPICGIVGFIEFIQGRKRGTGMIDCRYCANMDDCQYIVAPNDCEDFEETFEHHWEMMDDIEREEYNAFRAESEE